MCARVWVCSCPPRPCACTAARTWWRAERPVPTTQSTAPLKPRAAQRAQIRERVCGRESDVLPLFFPCPLHRSVSTRADGRHRAAHRRDSPLSLSSLLSFCRLCFAGTPRWLCWERARSAAQRRPLFLGTHTHERGGGRTTKSRHRAARPSRARHTRRGKSERAQTYTLPSSSRSQPHTHTPTLVAGAQQRQSPHTNHKKKEETKTNA